MDDAHDRGRHPNLRVLPGGEEAEVRSRRADDEALVSAFLVGDDEAFGELVRRHEGLVLSIARRYAR
jgi:RNA polymerase sigma-70 factor (ECF subfamily)